MQRVCNTAFESIFGITPIWTKSLISPEVTDLGIAHGQQIRIGRFWTGAGYEGRDGIARSGSSAGTCDCKSCQWSGSREDRGGRIGTYVDKYQDLRSSGQSVIIDGLCASACTIVLGAVPHDKICVTSHAALGFHAAWDMGSDGRAVTNPEATHMLYLMYPSAVRHWIKRRGGLTRHMIFLRGRQLADMYRPCYLDAQASSAR